MAHINAASAQQEKEMKLFAANRKERAAQIQKLSVQAAAIMIADTQYLIAHCP